MSNTTTTTALADELETLIDRHGLKAVLTAIQETCDAKAEHLTTNWQSTDKYGLASPKAWERAASALITAQNAVARAGLA